MPAHLDVAHLKLSPGDLDTLLKYCQSPAIFYLEDIFVMPLVVPGINSSMGDKSEWVNKLMGKKISETGGDETVCFPSYWLEDI